MHRFKAPQISSMRNFADMVVDNLIYFQTNYFMTTILMVALVSFFNPGAMLLVILTMAAGKFTIYMICPETVSY